MSPAARLARALSRPFPWAILGLGLRFMPAEGPRSSLSGLDWPLYAGVIGGLAAQARGWDGLRPAPLTAALTYLALTLVFGGLYELSLTVDGTGWGGMHPDTRTSFHLAFGDYAMLAFACVAAIRWLRLDVVQLFWFSFGASMTEGAVFTGVLWQVPVLAMPLFAAYYALAYATFLVLPALVVAPSSLWRDGSAGRARPGQSHTGKTGLVPLIVLGFAVAFAVRVVWGLVYAPIATGLFDLMPPVI